MITSEFIFLGKPLDYWLELKAHVDKNNYDCLYDEIYILKREITKYKETISHLKETINKC